MIERWRRHLQVEAMGERCMSFSIDSAALGVLPPPFPLALSNPLCWVSLTERVDLTQLLNCFYPPPQKKARCRYFSHCNYLLKWKGLFKHTAEAISKRPSSASYPSAKTEPQTVVTEQLEEPDGGGLHPDLQNTRKCVWWNDIALPLVMQLVN